MKMFHDLRCALFYACRNMVKNYCLPTYAIYLSIRSSFHDALTPGTIRIEWQDHSNELLGMRKEEVLNECEA